MVLCVSGWFRLEIGREVEGDRGGSRSPVGMVDRQLVFKKECTSGSVTVE